MHCIVIKHSNCRIYTYSNIKKCPFCFKYRLYTRLLRTNSDYVVTLQQLALARTTLSITDNSKRFLSRLLLGLVLVPNKSRSMGTGIRFPGVKCPGGEANNSGPSSAKNNITLYVFSA